MRKAWSLVAVLVLLVPGCLRGDDAQDGLRTPDGRIDHAAVAAAIGTPIVMDHDHTDASLHTASYNLELVSSSATPASA